jgi:putative FmdB family regulatory protein
MNAPDGLGWVYASQAGSLVLWLPRCPDRGEDPMPLYDYQCAACETVFEAEHGMAERPKLRCPKCRSTRVSKVFNAASVQFKTGGFYVTDSRSKEKTATESAAKALDSKPEAKPDSNPDTKQESKPEAAPAKAAEPVAASKD